MAMNNVLVLTYEEDPHASSVCNYFKENEVKFFRVNTDKLIGNFYITFDSRSGFFSIFDNSDKIIVDQTWNVWNRRIVDPEIPADMPKDLEKIIILETKKMWEGLLFSSKGKVVNRPQAQMAANNKINQLLFARDYGDGIKIPDTVLTNDPGKLIKFFKENPKICHKLQQQSFVEKNGEALTMYTNLVNEEHLKNADLLVKNPCLFQTYAEKSYELRITALEDRSVGIAIHSQNSEISKIDWRRYDFERVKYEKVELPQKVEDFCKRLIRHYGLSFGQIDMIVTPKGEYVFLELNPNGQWLWLEEQSRYNLTKDISENLIKC